MSDEGSDGEDQESQEIEWNDSPDDVELLRFTQRVGPTRAMPQNSSVLDYFLLLFTMELLQLKADNMNAFATVIDLDREEMRGDFAYTFVNEIKALLGVVILMGIVKLPKLFDYWSTDERFYQPSIAKVFSQDHFLQLMRYLHISDPAATLEKNHSDYKLYRVKPVIQVVAQTFKKMVKFKGRIGFLQYMPMKPCKRGIKIWCRCDSPNGYLCQSETYIGKESEPQVALLPGQAKGSIPAVVH